MLFNALLHGNYYFLGNINYQRLNHWKKINRKKDKKKTLFMIK